MFSFHHFERPFCYGSKKSPKSHLTSALKNKNTICCLSCRLRHELTWALYLTGGQSQKKTATCSFQRGGEEPRRDPRSAVTRNMNQNLPASRKNPTRKQKGYKNILSSSFTRVRTNRLSSTGCKMGLRTSPRGSRGEATRPSSRRRDTNRRGREVVSRHRGSTEESSRPEETPRFLSSSSIGVNRKVGPSF